MEHIQMRGFSSSPQGCALRLTQESLNTHLLCSPGASSNYTKQKYEMNAV